MSGSLLHIQRKIQKARMLSSVVRTMKTLAAMHIRQYEDAVRAVGDYAHTIDIALGAAIRATNRELFSFRFQEGKELPSLVAVLFGSDQGLVGQFNEQLVSYASSHLEHRSRMHIIAVGERIVARMADLGLDAEIRYDLPGSLDAVTELTEGLLESVVGFREMEGVIELRVFHNRPSEGAVCEPFMQRLLPLDGLWRDAMVQKKWPTQRTPQLIGKKEYLDIALILEYLFVSFFRACAESLAGENASRLSAMQRAEKNIDEIVTDLENSYHSSRQAAIDEELFDVLSGFNALSGSPSDNPHGSGC